MEFCPVNYTLDHIPQANKFQNDMLCMYFLKVRVSFLNLLLNDFHFSYIEEYVQTAIPMKTSFLCLQSMYYCIGTHMYMYIL